MLSPATPFRSAPTVNGGTSLLNAVKPLADGETTDADVLVENATASDEDTIVDADMPTEQRRCSR